MPVVAPDEQGLIQRLKGREEAALAVLMAQYGARVFSLAMRMTGSRQDAEEVLQDVFWTVFEKIGGFRGDSKLSYTAKPNTNGYPSDKQPSMSRSARIL